MPCNARLMGRVINEGLTSHPPLSSSPEENQSLTRGDRQIVLTSASCGEPGQGGLLLGGRHASDQHHQAMYTNGIELCMLMQLMPQNVTKAVHQGPTKLRLPADHPLESLASQSRFKSQKSKLKSFIEVQHLVHQFSHNFRGERICLQTMMPTPSHSFAPRNDGSVAFGPGTAANP